MTRRATRASRRGASGAAPRRAAALTTFTPPEHDPLSDSRLRPLVERYASLGEVTIDEQGPQLIELRLPESERAFFDGRERVLVAFTVPALELSPEAEMAVVGSGFVEQLLAAIRSRGARLTLGEIPGGDDSEPADFPVAVRNGTVRRPKVKRSRHPIGRLLARVVIRAGAAVEEHLVESGLFDLATAEALPNRVTAACVAVEQDVKLPAGRSARKRVASARPLPELVELMVDDLRGKLASRIDRLRAEAERALVVQLERIDSYFHSMLEVAAAKRQKQASAEGFVDEERTDAARAVEAEHARRRIEEERRHQVRTVVHPLQLTEMEILKENARWTITDASGGQTALSASRYRCSGVDNVWDVRCPSCGCEPSELIAAGDGIIVCSRCADTSASEAAPA